MLCSVLSATVSAIAQQNPVYTEGGTVEGKEDAFPAIQSTLAHLVERLYRYAESVQNDFN